MGTPSRVHIYNIRFDLGKSNQKVYSPVYRLIYWPKTNKWAIRGGK
jgi:hypothetical protein